MKAFKHIWYWIIFAFVFLFLYSFFVTEGPIKVISQLFMKIYNGLPGTAGVFGFRDLLVFTLVYAGWYIFISMFSYLFYYVKRVVLLKKAEHELAKSHGMLDEGSK